MTLAKYAAFGFAGLLAGAFATPSFAYDGVWWGGSYGYDYGYYGYYAAAPYLGNGQWGMTYVPPGYTFGYGPYYPGWPGFRSDYNPEQPIDPDPRIGGSFRMKSSED